jgi:ferredoxin
MTFVVTDNCKRCFHADDEMLYIDPDECIDCGACVPECPVEAIFDESQVPEDQHDWIAVNAEKSKKLPVINTTAGAYPGAEDRKKQLGF